MLLPLTRPGARLLSAATTPVWLTPSPGSPSCHLVDTAIPSYRKNREVISHNRQKESFPITSPSQYAGGNDGWIYLNVTQQTNHSPTFPSSIMMAKWHVT
jgi:hypothetical protein